MENVKNYLVGLAEALVEAAKADDRVTFMKTLQSAQFVAQSYFGVMSVIDYLNAPEDEEKL